MVREISLGSAAIVLPLTFASLLNPTVPSRVDIMGNDIVSLAYSRPFHTLLPLKSEPTCVYFTTPPSDSIGPSSAT